MVLRRYIAFLNDFIVQSNVKFDRLFARLLGSQLHFDAVFASLFDLDGMVHIPTARKLHGASVIFRRAFPAEQVLARKLKGRKPSHDIWCQPFDELGCLRRSQAIGTFHLHLLDRHIAIPAVLRCVRIIEIIEESHPYVVVPLRQLRFDFQLLPVHLAGLPLLRHCVLAHGLSSQSHGNFCILSARFRCRHMQDNAVRPSRRHLAGRASRRLAEQPQGTIILEGHVFAVAFELRRLDLDARPFRRRYLHHHIRKRPRRAHVLLHVQGGNGQHIADVVVAIARVVLWEIVRRLHVVHLQQIANGVVVLRAVQPPHRHVPGIRLLWIEPKHVVVDPFHDGITLRQFRRWLRLWRHHMGHQHLPHMIPKLHVAP